MLGGVPEGRVLVAAPGAGLERRVPEAVHDRVHAGEGRVNSLIWKKKGRGGRGRREDEEEEGRKREEGRVCSLCFLYLFFSSSLWLGFMPESMFLFFSFFVLVCVCCQQLKRFGGRRRRKKKRVRSGIGFFFIFFSFLKERSSAIEQAKKEKKRVLRPFFSPLSLRLFLLLRLRALFVPRG